MAGLKAARIGPRSVAGYTATPQSETPKQANAFYVSREWRAFRAAVRRERPVRCEQCGKTHEDDGSAVRLILDHIVEMSDGGAPLDRANVQLLCTRLGGNGDGLGGCNARKTVAARRDRGGM